MGGGGEGAGGEIYGGGRERGAWLENGRRGGRNGDCGEREEEGKRGR